MARTFPLYLTYFESYMLLDDGPDFPMTFVVEFVLSGQVNRSALDAACGAALERHPLLRAVVQPAKRGKDCWVAAPEPTQIRWLPLDSPIEFDGGEAINLRDEPGLRIWARSDDERCVITAQFHHAACDGIGSYQFLGDLFWFYAKQMGEEVLPDLPGLDPVALRNRGIKSYDPQRFKKENGKYRSELKEFRTLVLGKFAPIRPRTKTVESNAVTFPGVQTHTFEKSEFKSLRLAAQDLGQTTNEALLEHLFETVQEWNQRLGVANPRQSLCVMVPMDLRENLAREFSAMNCVTYAVLRRPSQTLQDMRSLGDSLVAEMTQLKQRRHETSFMNIAASASDRHPFFTWLVLGRNRSLASAVLSNTGDPTRSFYVDFPRDGGKARFGNLVLEDVSGVPPMRRGTHATISIFTYRRLLKICLRCTPKLFADADAKSLLDLFVERIKSRISG